MPTNLLRSNAKPQGSAKARAAHAPGRIVLTAGRVSIRAELLDTLTARRIAQALPLFSTAETWGAAIHFEVPIESGRERNARMTAERGELAFWSNQDRVIVAFDATPISRPGEIRLPAPCNVFARALDDVGLLKAVRPGEKVSLRRDRD